MNKSKSIFVNDFRKETSKGVIVMERHMNFDPSLFYATGIYQGTIRMEDVKDSPFFALLASEIEINMGAEQGTLSKTVSGLYQNDRVPNT